MPNPVYLITGAVALGVALYALFAQQRYNKPITYNNDTSNRPSPSAAFYREECSICKDLLSFPTLALECGHVFHRECIQQSIMLCSRSCPNCRRPIPRALL